MVGSGCEGSGRAVGEDSGVEGHVYETNVKEERLLSVPCTAQEAATHHAVVPSSHTVTFHDASILTS